ncbi:hypothetical protein C0995_001080 [Termitomyces sp. Mi166|nr:hypothetical protein C0995_001080 [Termitomyces sp. Mi166\
MPSIPSRNPPLDIVRLREATATITSSPEPTNTTFVDLRACHIRAAITLSPRVHEHDVRGRTVDSTTPTFTTLSALAAARSLTDSPILRTTASNHDSRSAPSSYTPPCLPKPSDAAQL